MAKITAGLFHRLLNQWASDKITISRLVELLNEQAGRPEKKPKKK